MIARFPHAGRRSDSRAEAHRGPAEILPFPEQTGARQPVPNRPLRLLCMLDELDIGGTEQQILELTRRIDRRHFEPLVCCFRHGRKAREIESLGVPVFRVEKRHKLDITILPRLVRLLRRERIDILQTFLWTANAWGRAAGRLAGVPVIVAGERNVDIWEQSYKRVIGRALARMTDRIVGNSEAVRTYLLERGGLAPELVTTIHNGVNFERFDTPIDPMERRRELGIPDDALLAGVVARVEPAKDHETLLRALAHVRDRTGDVHLAVVGDGSLRPGLEKLAHELGIGERVHFTGFRTDAAEWIASFDFSVLSSRKEGLSNTVIESMAAGRPVIATAVGGNPEVIVEGETGFLLPVHAPEAFGEAIAQLVSDRERLRAMGAAGHKRVRELFSVEQMVEKTSELYLDLAARKASLIR